MTKEIKQQEAELAELENAFKQVAPFTTLTQQFTAERELTTDKFRMVIAALESIERWQQTIMRRLEMLETEMAARRGAGGGDAA